MLDYKIVQKIAERYNEHPIHVEIFLMQYKPSCFSEESLSSAYSEYRVEKPKPFVKWVGGKRQLAQQFRALDLYPPGGFRPDKATYFEPFVGGGAMFFDLIPKRAVLSDLNSELVITYNVIRNDLGLLIKKLKEHQKKNSFEYYLRIRAQDTKKLSDINNAARFIYLNRTCFNGLYRVNKSGQFNVP